MTLLDKLLTLWINTGQKWGKSCNTPLRCEPLSQGAAKGVRQKEFDHFFSFSGRFRSLSVTFSDASVTFFVTFLPNSFCWTPFAAGWLSMTKFPRFFAIFHDFPRLCTTFLHCISDLHTASRDQKVSQSVVTCWKWACTLYPKNLSFYALNISEAILENPLDIYIYFKQR